MQFQRTTAHKVKPSFEPVQNGLLQRTCAYGDTPNPTGERNKRFSLQHKAPNLDQPVNKGFSVPPVFLSSLGQPLGAETRAFFESRFGHDFSRVRVHSDDRAARAAGALHAAAFTLGNDIIFGRNRYAPATPDGRLLLHHELRHVAQQRSAVRVAEPELDPPESSHEQQACSLFDPNVKPLAVQRVQCSPDDVQFSLGHGVIDTVGRSTFGDSAWPFLKAVFEGFVGALMADVKSSRAKQAMERLTELFLNPWNAFKFNAGFLLGLVVGLVSPITDLVKGIIGAVRLAISALDWATKLATSPERQQRIVQLVAKFGDLAKEWSKAVDDFKKDPQETLKKIADLLDNLMQLALGKAHEIGAKAAHSIFVFLEKDFSEMGKSIGEVIGALVAQVLLLVFTDAIGNLISKGASVLGKAAEVVAGKAVEVFEWVKGFASQVVSVIRSAVRGALRMFEGLANKAIEAFDALKTFFTEAEALETGGEKVAAGVGRGFTGPPSPKLMESRMVSSTRTAPAKVSDLRPPKVHPSNISKEPPTRPELGKAPFDEPLTKSERGLTQEQLRQKHILEEKGEFQSAAQDVTSREVETGPGMQERGKVGLPEDHHIATKYRKENKAIFDRLKMSIDDDLNMIVDFEEHGQLRGWYDWNKRGYKFYMKGHHPEYNAWVTKLLQEASPEGLAPDKALKRVEKVLQELKKLVRENPELLSHGPGISPKFKNLKIPFE
jgi:hypothetical protein